MRARLKDLYLRSCPGNCLPYGWRLFTIDGPVAKDDIYFDRLYVIDKTHFNFAGKCQHFSRAEALHHSSLIGLLLGTVHSRDSIACLVIKSHYLEFE